MNPWPFSVRIDGRLLDQPMKSRYRMSVVVALVLSALMVTNPSTRASGSCATDPTNACAASKGLDEIPANIVRVGSVIGVVNGDVHEVFYYGTVNRSPRAPAPTGTTLFAIGSITKTMTATLLALYDRRGLVHIPSVPPKGPFNMQLEPRATRLQEVLPPSSILPCPRKEITLLDLADHHSGLPRNGKKTDTTVADLYADLAFCPGCICPGPPCSSCQPPGSYCYSNFGYMILGHVLAGVTGAQTWAQVNQSQIMQPLGMTDTNVQEGYTAAQDFAGRAAKGYWKNGSPSPQQGAEMMDSPAGGLWSTPDDMMRWLLYNMSPPGQSIVTTRAKAELLSLLPALHYPRAAVEQHAQTDCTDGSEGVTTAERVGLAWQMTPLGASGSRTAIIKGGSVGGFRAYIAFEPASKKGVFVLLNYSVDAPDLGRVAKTTLLNLP